MDVSESAYDNNKLEVIDGQQRLTTLSILLLVLYDRIFEYKEMNLLTDEEIQELGILKWELVPKDLKHPRITLQKQEQNNCYYYSGGD